MASLKRQITDLEKQQVMEQQRRSGVLYCFADDHPIDDADDIEFHHIQPFSEDGPTDPANIGAVCKDHHRRIRTLSLSEFRDQLAMDRFFTDAVPRRLDDLLRLKLAVDGFGRAVKVDELRDGQLTLRFTRPERAAQTCAIFACPATGMRYFYSMLPIEYLANDSDLQPRPLEQKRIWELYRHLSAHTQLAPAVCRLVAGKVLLFDGQHKSAAQDSGQAARRSTARCISSPTFAYSKIRNLVAMTSCGRWRSSRVPSSLSTATSSSRSGRNTWSAQARRTKVTSSRS